ncbi:hypothetical protein MLAC_04900 [Mycobacterium lacus]|uniref:Uncharacterized protein n=1 Tax=Mycobacterium lacus TaxID=169765 RepID=A0A7I7NEV1_9MYCO|nr:hypothetical protein MLAC_04900 [Mycobacterium lacus]
MNDNQVHPVFNRRPAEFGPMTTVVGVLNDELKATLECVRNEVASGRCGGGGGGIHDQNGTHDARA